MVKIDSESSLGETIGKFLLYILAAGVAILILIFVLTQLMQVVSKGPKQYLADIRGKPKDDALLTSPKSEPSTPTSLPQ